MELEPRTAAPAHATGAVEFVPLSAVADDATFQLRDADDVSLLAASIGRLGQLAPVELRPIPGAPTDGPRFQVVAGFRRIAALRMLMRERVLARVHHTLDDDDAWGLALGHALLTEPLDREALRRLGDRLRDAGVAPWAEELLDEALVRAPLEPELRERFFEFLGGAPAAEEAAVAPESQDAAVRAAAEGEVPAAPAPVEGGAIEVTPEELVDDLAARLYQVTADLDVAADAWRDLPRGGRRQILDQVRWIAQLLPHLESDGDDER